MITIAGKCIPTELAEILRPPQRCALVVVDLQNDFCHAEGAFGRRGFDVGVYDSVVGNASRLVAAAEACGALVVYLLNTALPGFASESEAQLRLAWKALRGADGRFEGALGSYTLEGSWGQQLIAGLRRAGNAVFVRKFRSSGFAGTGLDTVLRSNHVRTVILAGCTTEGCVDSTARDAGFLDYFPVIAEDAVGTPDARLHEAALTVLRAYRADVVRTDNIIALWCGPANGGDDER